MIKRIEDDFGLKEELARWAVESWAVALGIEFPAAPSRTPLQKTESDMLDTVLQEIHIYKTPAAEPPPEKFEASIINESPDQKRRGFNKKVAIVVTTSCIVVLSVLGLIFIKPSNKSLWQNSVTVSSEEAENAHSEQEPVESAKPNNWNGRGEKTYSNGDRYEGNFVDGKRNGKGIYTWSDGTRYEGDFVDGKRQGKGVQTWPDGQRYEGDWVNDKRQGKGEETHSNGEHYEGNFVDGKRNGKGIYTWPNGQRYEGDWVNDKRNGYGTQYFPDGTIKQGRWNDDQYDEGPYLILEE